MKDNKGYEYQIGCLYEFSDSLDFLTSRITILTGIEDNLYTTPYGNFIYIAEIGDKLGRIEEPKVKLINGSYYYCIYEDDTKGVYYYYDNDWYDSYRSRILNPEELRPLSKLVCV
jgi:hypothetical protein